MIKSEEIKVKVESHEANSNKLPPIVTYFPSNYDPLKISKSQTVKVYKNINRKNRYQVKIIPNGSDIEFVGTNYEGEDTVPQLSSYALGVFDKNAGVLKLLPIAGQKIFRLESKVGKAEELEDAPKNPLTAEERAKATEDLQKKYSTKNVEREHKKRSALHATEDDETRKSMDITIKRIKVHEEAQEGADSYINARNVPPYDLAVSHPSRAYPLEKFIFQGEWKYLLDVFNISQGKGEVTPEVYPSFVCNRFHKLESIQDVNEKRKLAGIFSLITHLIHYKDKCSGVRSAARHKIPGILSKKFSSMFSESELLIGYVLVLTLHVDDFRTDLTDIAKDLGMHFCDLRSYYETLGCKFVREKSLWLATLEVPLTFPETTGTKKRRNR